MDYSIGQVIYSKSGRDKRRPFIVMNVDGDYLYLSDGKLRLIEKPKKKKIMHVQATHEVDDEIASLIESKKVKNSDIREALKEYRLD